MVEVNIKSDNRHHVPKHNLPKQLCNRQHLHMFRALQIKELNPEALYSTSRWCNLKNIIYRTSCLTLNSPTVKWISNGSLVLHNQVWERNMWDVRDSATQHSLNIKMLFQKYNKAGDARKSSDTRDTTTENARGPAEFSGQTKEYH